MNQRFLAAKHAGEADNQNATGKFASFICGVSVAFSLNIDSESKKITSARYKSNGCGFVVATADLVCETAIGKKLTELEGLEVLEKIFRTEFGDFPDGRKHCSDICFDAFQNALAEYRSSLLEEWTGEKALICTCFGVSEEIIEKKTKDDSVKTVDDIGEVCNAGTGCGSCQPLIQEILDTQKWD